MATPIIDPAPADPAYRRQIIAGSNNEHLRQILNFALSRMHALSHETRPAHADYSIWEAFVNEIKAEQGKRLDREVMAVREGITDAGKEPGYDPNSESAKADVAHLARLLEERNKL
jgi:hypothetical protein